MHILILCRKRCCVSVYTDKMKKKLVHPSLTLSYVWDRSIGLWLWGVFQPNQEIKCLFAQLDRPTTNQSNVVCDYCSGGSLACFCVYWTKRCRMSPDVSGTRRAQAALLPGARYEPRVSPVRGPGAPLRAEMSAGLRGGDGLSAARLAAVSLG